MCYNCLTLGALNVGVKNMLYFTSLVRQTVFKTLPKSFYFDGHCSDYNVSQEIKSEAVKRYAGLVEGGYFKVSARANQSVISRTDAQSTVKFV